MFGGLTAGAIHEQSTDCSGPTPGACTNYSGAASAHSTANTDGAVSTVAFIAGGALLATGVVMYLLPAHGSREKGAAARLIVAPSLGVGAGGLLLRGSF